MEPEPGDVAVGAAMLLIGLASLVVLFRLFQKHIDGRPLLAYEPRRPVPWNALAPAIILFLLALAWGGRLFEQPGEEPPNAEILAAISYTATAAAAAPPGMSVVSSLATVQIQEVAEDEQDASRLVIGMWAQSAMTLLLAVACYVVLALLVGATREDLGLPTSWRQFRRDVGIGATACIASMLPIYAILVLLSQMVEAPEQHPLIEELMVNHSLGMMAAAAFTAIIAAPIYEETAFRLVFQGWLEKRTTGVRSTPIAGETDMLDSIENGGEPLPVDETAAPAGQGESSQPSPGWAPIVVAGTLFGLAHVGQGLSPLPLILLGGVLGYLYQRTHRVVPSITCHLLFNSFTFVMLVLKFALSP